MYRSLHKKMSINTFIIHRTKTYMFIYKVYKHNEAQIYQKLSIFLRLIIEFCLAIVQHPTL